MTKTKGKTITFNGIEFEYVRNGCDPDGWRMSPDIYYRCIECGYVMSGSPYEDDVCDCKRLYKDCGVGRFGSELGDNNIEVYIITKAD